MPSIKLTLNVLNTSGIMSRAIIVLSKFAYRTTEQSITETNNSKYSRLTLKAEGKNFQEGISEALLAIEGVISIVNIEIDKPNESINHRNMQTHSKKQHCKQIMISFFGETVADSIDSMTEENCVALCRAKVKGLIGEQEAKAFDNIT